MPIRTKLEKVVNGTITEIAILSRIGHYIQVEYRLCGRLCHAELITL